MANPKRAAGRPTREAVEKFFQRIPPRSFDMLRVMRELGPAPSFERVGQQLGHIDKRIVAAELRRLDAAYEELTNGGQLLVREGRQYQLTSAGEALADELMDANRHMADLLRGTATMHREAWVPVTNECMKLLPPLKEALRRSGSDVILRAAPHRSTDLLPTARSVVHGSSGGIRASRSWHHAFFSACLIGKEIRQDLVSEVSSFDGPTGVIVVDQQPFMVLARDERFPGTDTVTVKDLWDLDGGLIVPEGGAVRDFLDSMEGGWERRRAYQGATDLETGLSCLTIDGLVDRAALIVHGSSKFENLINDGYRLFAIADAGDQKAVTGLFRRNDLADHLPDGKRKIWHTIWEAAANQWIPSAVEQAE